MSLLRIIVLGMTALMVGSLVADIVLTSYGMAYRNFPYIAFLMSATVLTVPVVWSVMSLFETRRKMGLLRIIILGLAAGLAVTLVTFAVLRFLGVLSGSFYVAAPAAIVAMIVLLILSRRFGADKSGGALKRHALRRASAVSGEPASA